MHEDHPRGCGENDAVLRMPFNTSGSPPRMRGKHRAAGRERNVAGITPADAGKTSTSDTVACERRDHPRGCGENSPVRQVGRNGKGSPPRMRGKPGNCRGNAAEAGITPADAGKTFSARLRFWFSGDHPRGCGENNLIRALKRPATGSPPRMRGKHAVTSSDVISTRITPADAGKTCL